MIDRPGLDTWLARYLHSSGLVELETLQQLVHETRAERRLGGVTLARSLVQRRLLGEEQVSACLARVLGEAPALDLNVRAPGGPAPWTPNREVGEYVLESRIGAGGMGEVFLARHKESGAKRALKTMLAGADEELTARFEREGAAQAALSGHPNVAQVHTAGFADGRLYLVMELVEGESLEARLRRGAMPPEEAARVVIDLARGVAHAHALGVLHRDLKPDNVLLTSKGTPKLVDFGLARVAWEGSLTQSGALLGTPAFMPPEQASGAPELIDERSDVYGLGAILYCCLSGQPPFRGSGVMQLLLQVMEKTPDPPSKWAPGVPHALDAVCLRALAKEPEARPPSASAFADELQLALSAGTSAGSLGARWVLLLALVLLVGFGLAIAFLEPPRAETLGAPSSTPPPRLSAAELQRRVDSAVSGRDWNRALLFLRQQTRTSARLELEAQCCLLAGRPREALAALGAVDSRSSRTLQALKGVAAFRSGSNARRVVAEKERFGQAAIRLLQTKRDLLARARAKELSFMEFRGNSDPEAALRPLQEEVERLCNLGVSVGPDLGSLLSPALILEIQFAVCEASLAILNATRGARGPSLDSTRRRLEESCRAARSLRTRGPGQLSLKLIPLFRAWARAEKVSDLDPVWREEVRAMAANADEFPLQLRFAATGLAYLSLQGPELAPQSLKLLDRTLAVHARPPWLRQLEAVISGPASSAKFALACDRLFEDPKDRRGFALAQEAVKLARLAATHRGHSSDFMHLARAMLVVGDFEGARAALAKGEDHWMWSVLAIEVNLAQGRLDEAEKLIDQVVERIPEEVPAQRALLQALRGDLEGAKATLTSHSGMSFYEHEMPLPWRNLVRTRATLERDAWPGLKR